jgi:hypothetical protein
MLSHEERNRLIDDLRARGVQEYVEDDKVVRVVLFPERPAHAKPDDDNRPLPRPTRTLDEKLMGPLGIGKDGKG